MKENLSFQIGLNVLAMPSKGLSALMFKFTTIFIVYPNLYAATFALIGYAPLLCPVLICAGHCVWIFLSAMASGCNNTPGTSKPTPLPHDKIFAFFYFTAN